MNNDPLSHGLWEASAPPAPTTDPLRAHVHADVAIVGGGFTGLSAALHCAEAGLRAVVLEASEIGYGGSGRNVGLVNAGMWVHPEVVTRELGAVYGPRLLTALGDGPAAVFDLIERHNIDCETARHGTLHCAVGQRGLHDIRERARQWQALGAPVRVLDAAETAVKTGTRAYTGALLDERAGTIQPLAYARGLAHAALGAGAQLHTRTPVTSVSDQGNTWQLDGAHGSVTAPHVIIATNAYTVKNAPWTRLQSEIIRLPYFNLATRPLSDTQHAAILPERQGAWDTALVMSSFRRDQAGRMIFGSVGALRATGRTVHPDWGRRALGKLFPALRDTDFEHQWYGWIGMTANNLPRLHQLARNTWSCSGYNGRGIAPGTVFGRELARLASGQITVEEMPLPLVDISRARLRSARSQGYEQGATAAHLIGARF